RYEGAGQYGRLFRRNRRNRRFQREVLEHRAFVGFQKLQDGEQHLFLEGRVIRRTEGPSQLKGYPQRPRRPDFLGMEANQAYLCSGDSRLFQETGQHADGARTVWSDRYQQNGINLVSLE
ncbi:MAG: hypothetical protein HW402_785, partial [Dehalococcoidales bacterium]|nr:hypothetical protein [Dehalococcoidales bacterium]